MSWLKSPWFWLLLILGAVLVWLFFFRAPARSGASRAPANAGTGTGFWGFLDSIESRFSIGDSIMGGGGSG